MRFEFEGQEYEGPPLNGGALAGFTLGELRFAKRQLHLANLDTLDSTEALVVYGMLAIRRKDHRIVPFDRFEDLRAADFELLPHPYVRDRDGDCRECSRGENHWLHEDQGEANPPEPPATETPMT